MAIGQGPISMTPLKMAAFYTALARSDAKTPVLRIAVPEDTAQRDTTIDLRLKPEHLDWLWKGMRRVVGPGGTAALTRLEHWDLLGKTGTAQVCAGCPIKDHAWFVSMAGPRGKDPEIVTAILMEHAEHGYTASNYSVNAMNFYLDRKYGHPFDPEPTLGERWRAGRSGTAGQWDEPNRRLVPPRATSAATGGSRDAGDDRPARRGTGDAETPKRENATE